MKTVAGKKLQSEMGGYIVIYEQELTKYHRKSVGAIADEIIA